MNRLTRIRALAASLLALAVAAPICSAAEVELSGANKTASADGNVTTYTGDVTLKVPAGTQVHWMRGKSMKRERGVETLRGEVEIKLDTMIVRTQQANITRNDKFILVKMEAAEVTKVGP
jgi:lipopolysaccharide export system protein LptA